MNPVFNVSLLNASGLLLTDINPIAIDSGSDDETSLWEDTAPREGNKFVSFFLFFGSREDNDSKILITFNLFTI